MNTLIQHMVDNGVLLIYFFFYFMRRTLLIYFNDEVQRVIPLIIFLKNVG